MKIINPQVQQILLVMAYSLIFYLVLQPTERFVFFGIGLLLGWLLLLLDEKKLHQYYQEPTVAQPQLITRSVLFLLGLVPMTLFVVFSTGSLVGAGMVLGINLLLVFELWQTRADGAQFHQRFGQQLGRQLELREIGALATLAVGFFVVISLLALR